MKPDRHGQIEKVYHAALDREPGERAAFLEQACRGDEELHRQVESLLAYDEAARDFIETPPDDIAAAMLAAEQKQSVLGRTLGHYEILSLLGTGGMGEVYLARDKMLERSVALKLLPAELAADRERMRRFVREAKAASALKHPNVATIFEIGQADGINFIAMEHVEGQSLEAKINGRPLDSDLIVDIGIQAADALDEAHSKGITHRDVKSANIMITGRGQAKILDFGLARITLQEPPSVASNVSTALKTGPAVVMGTVPYMSPEQALGKDVDHRTDVFSLGVVIYEMATGRLPFSGATESEIIDNITHSQPEAISRFNYNVRAELERIVRKCLEKERERRYGSARELLVDLKNLKRDSDLAAVKTGEVAAQRGSSSRRLALIAIILAVLLIAGAAIVHLANSSRKAIDSIAVLPFANASGDPKSEYLSDGIPESIINSLSQLPNLKVMSRNSAFRFKGRDIDVQEVARTLAVRAVLTGSVAQRAESLSINIELVDARDNSQIWGQQYNRRLADVFALQEEMAEEISENLRLKLTGVERQQLARRSTGNLKAFEYYIQGRSYASRRAREDLLAGIHSYEKALEEDRDYALAYAGLAEAYTVLGARGYVEPDEGHRKAEEAARKALALDDTLAEAHVAIGQPYTDFTPYNFSVGDRELRRGIELSPSLAIGHQYLGNSLARQGRLDESLAEHLKARELDPLSPIIARQVAGPYFFKRDYKRALDVLRQADELGPAVISTWEIGVYIQNGLLDDTLAELKRAKRERENDPIVIYSIGMVYAAQRKRAEALEIIKELEDMPGANVGRAHWIAKIYSVLNENEMALTWLERGFTAGAIGAFFKDDPVWDTIRGNQRFLELLSRMRVPPYG